MHRILFVLIALVFGSMLNAADSTSLKMEPIEFRSASGETVNAESGELTVPENRQSPGTRTIRLKFIKFPASGTSKNTPIIYLAGGPGGSGIDAARGSRFPLFQAMREFGDVIAFDQRGTGKSEPDLKCTESYALPFTQVSRPQAGKILADAAQQCFARLKGQGIDLSAYNTRESAADLNDLRIALGAPKMTLWGISYGTHLALATMKYHGNAIDKVILAGVEPLHHSYKLPEDQHRLMEQISELARKDPKISAVIPDLLETTRKLLAKLEKNPETVELTHPLNGMSAELTVGTFDLQYALAEMLTAPSSFAAMPDFLYRLEKGDWTALALVSARSRMGNVPGAMSIAMDCASGADPEWLAKIAAQAPRSILGDAINFPFPEICEGLPQLGPEFRTPVKSEIPALLISGTLDGRTPPENAKGVAATLKNVKHLIIQGAGHSDPLFLSSPEILKTMQLFLRSQPIGSLDIVVKPDSFLAPRNVATAPSAVLDRYAGKYRINAKEIRTVIKAGTLLYTQRGDASPLPLRSMSETDFFYEGSATWVRFDAKEPDQKLSGNGSFAFVNGMWFDDVKFAPRTFYSMKGVLQNTKPEKLDATIDLNGKFVVPPFAEAHNHNVEGSTYLDEVIQKYLNAGIFYVKNPNSLPRSSAMLKGKINTPESVDATFANGGLTATGGHPIQIVRRNIERKVWTDQDGEGAFYFTIDNSADLDKKWAVILAGKPDFIKTFLLYSEEFGQRKNDPQSESWRGLDPSLLPEIVARAHKAGLRVTTHIETAADFHNAVIAGVDEINHMPGFRPEKDNPASYANMARYEISEEDARLAGERKIVVVTTLGEVINVLFQIPPTAPEAELASQLGKLFQQNLQRLQSNGVRIAIGSDSYEGTSLDEIKSLHRLEAFDNVTLLKMWTENTALTIFPKRKIGRLTEGYEASFLVLNGDPTKDFSFVTDIQMRVKEGFILKLNPVQGMTVFQEGQEPGEYANRIP